jgi:hypothetical protein
MVMAVVVVVVVMIVVLMVVGRCGWVEVGGAGSAVNLGGCSRMQSDANKHPTDVVVHAMSKCGCPPLLNSGLFKSLTIVLCIRDDIGFVLSLALFLRFRLVDT